MSYHSDWARIDFTLGARPMVDFQHKNLVWDFSWPSSKPLHSSTPGGTTSARPNHALSSRVITLPNLRPSLVPYPRSLPI